MVMWLSELHHKFAGHLPPRSLPHSITTANILCAYDYSDAFWTHWNISKSYLDKTILRWTNWCKRLKKLTLIFNAWRKWFAASDGSPCRQQHSPNSHQASAHCGLNFSARVSHWEAWALRSVNSSSASFESQVSGWIVFKACIKKHSIDSMRNRKVQVIGEKLACQMEMTFRLMARVTLHRLSG